MKIHCRIKQITPKYTEVCYSFQNIHKKICILFLQIWKSALLKQHIITKQIFVLWGKENKWVSLQRMIDIFHLQKKPMIILQSWVGKFSTLADRFMQKHVFLPPLNRNIDLFLLHGKKFYWQYNFVFSHLNISWIGESLGNDF